VSSAGCWCCRGVTLESGIGDPRAGGELSDWGCSTSRSPPANLPDGVTSLPAPSLSTSRLAEPGGAAAERATRAELPLVLDGLRESRLVGQSRQSVTHWLRGGERALPPERPSLWQLQFRSRSHAVSVRLPGDLHSGGRGANAVEAPRHAPRVPASISPTCDQAGARTGAARRVTRPRPSAGPCLPRAMSRPRARRRLARGVGLPALGTRLAALPTLALVPLRWILFVHLRLSSVVVQLQLLVCRARARHTHKNFARVAPRCGEAAARRSRRAAA
jgi:hypothetical protein